MAPVRHVLAEIKRLQFWPSMDCQASIVEIFKSLESYHPSFRWSDELLKLVVNDIERSGGELTDSLVALVIEYKCRKATAETSYVTYRHPLIQQEVILRLQPNHNEVGLRPWEAGLFMAEVLLRASELLSNMIILELGSGIGTTGLILSSANIPFKEIAVTDYSEDVLLNLHYNLSFNRNRSVVQSRVSVQQLDWQLVAAGVSPVPCADIVLAADCTYSIELCDYLIEALYSILLSSLQTLRSKTDEVFVLEQSPTHTSNQLTFTFEPPFAILACTIRNEETYAYLLSLLANKKKAHAFEWQDLSSWANEVAGEQIFFYENRNNIRIIYISLTSNSEVIEMKS